MCITIWWANRCHNRFCFLTQLYVSFHVQQYYCYIHHTFDDNLENYLNNLLNYCYTLMVLIQYSILLTYYLTLLRHLLLLIPYNITCSFEDNDFLLSNSIGSSIGSFHVMHVFPLIIAYYYD